MKIQIIQLEKHDDVISARDKMAWCKAPRILLVYPRGSRILTRQVINQGSSLQRMEVNRGKTGRTVL